MKVKNVFTYFTDTILRRNANSYRNPRVRWAVRQYKLLFYTARGLIAHDTIVRSAALTFYTLISIVPILALVFAVVKGFGLLDGLIDDLYNIFRTIDNYSSTRLYFAATEETRRIDRALDELQTACRTAGDRLRLIDLDDAVNAARKPASGPQPESKHSER